MTAPPLPGPAALPLLGVYGKIIPFMRDPVGQMRHLQRTYGDITALARGRPRVVFVFAPEQIRQVLTDVETFYTITAPAPVPKNSAFARVTSGLLAMNGAQHAQQRRLMMPAFHKKRVDAYRDAMVTLTEQQIAGWHPGETRDLLAEMKQLTIAIAVQTLLGLDPQRDGRDLDHDLAEWLRLFFAPLTMAVPLQLPGLPYRRLLTLAEKFERQVLAMIQRKRAGGQDAGDVLSLLIQAHDADGSRLTDADLVAQTTTLFVAGHITTASALTWTLFLLAQHPPVLAALLDELDSTLQGAAPTVEQLSQLPLLDGVVHESLRLFPPLMWSLREARRPVTVGRYALPKGSWVVFSAVTTHRRPDLYPQPYKFWPERWQTIDPAPYEYLPFAGGPRRCIGASFALLELRLVVALIVQRYRLALPAGARVDHVGPVFSFPKGGLPMIVQAQDRQFSKVRVRGTVRRMVDLR